MGGVRVWSLCSDPTRQMGAVERRFYQMGWNRKKNTSCVFRKRLCLVSSETKPIASGDVGIGWLSSTVCWFQFRTVSFLILCLDVFFSFFLFLLYFKKMCTPSKTILVSLNLPSKPCEVAMCS